jgi:ribonuclease HI
MVVVFTDGSAKGNGKKNAIGSIGVFFPMKEYFNISLNTNVASKIYNIKIAKITNNTSELLAILHAVDTTKDSLKVIIKSDSRYSINCLTRWYTAWEKNNWLTAARKPVQNKEIIQKILILIKGKNVIFEHIPAHTKEPKNKTSVEWFNWYGNNEADKLTNLI